MNSWAEVEEVTKAFKAFTHEPATAAAPSGNDSATQAYVDHATAPRVNTDIVLTAALKNKYPQLHLTVAQGYSVPLLRYAAAGHATYTILDDSPKDTISSLTWNGYIPPARRIDGARGIVVDQLIYGKMMYRWRGYEFIVYYADGRDGMSAYPTVQNFYILSANVGRSEALMLEAGRWGSMLHDEVWVFDRGFWQKSRELFESIRNASWDNVILDAKKKKEIIDDHLSFFDSRETYKKLQVPWKRGLIYFGPPGNGKTISIKAMMHMLYSREDPIPTLYVRSLVSYAGPEAALQDVFNKARQEAPCYLVFEDLDTIITPQVRSYFFNEVDGLKNNDGIFMIGSTNHLDQLDPGIAKRPSRFDRKYLFNDPDVNERIAYCQFWQRKLADNKDVEFPDELCLAIAEITDKFSFAYMQEAFVASLLAIARKKAEKGAGRPVSRELTEELGDGWIGVLDDGDDGHPNLKGNVLWQEMQEQVANLREGLDEEGLKTT